MADKSDKDKDKKDKKEKTVKQSPAILKNLVRVRLVQQAFTSKVIAQVKKDSIKLMSKKISSIKVFLDQFLEDTNVYLKSLDLDPINWTEMQELVHLSFNAPVLLKTGIENKKEIHFVELRQKEFSNFTTRLGYLNPSKPETNWVSFFAEQEAFEDIELLQMFSED
jgi:hypothetical protein